MGLTISSLFSRLFGKKQMRILMGEWRPDSLRAGGVSVLGAASGPVCPSARCGGGGAAARGQEEFLRGNNGAKGGRSPQICLRSRAGSRDKVYSSGFGFLYLMLLKSDRIGRRCGGSELFWSRGARKTLARPILRVRSGSFFSGVGSGQDAGRTTPAFLLPLSAPCTHSAHSSGMWSERSPGARSRPRQEVTRPRAVAREHPRFQKSPESSAPNFAQLTLRWIPLRVLFLITVPENRVYLQSLFGHLKKLSMFGLLSLVFKPIFI